MSDVVTPKVDANEMAIQETLASIPPIQSAEPPAVEQNNQPETKQNLKKPFYFSLEKGGLNPVVDSCRQLLALLLRIHSLDDFDGVDALYRQVNDEVLSLDKKLGEQGVEDFNITRSACRFCLCAALDEAVFKKAWSQESKWQAKPLLSLYHRDAYLDDEFYQVLARLRINPTKYKDIIELFYLCLVFGYEGDYCAENGSQQKRQDSLQELKIQLSQYRENPVGKISEPHKHQVKKTYRIDVDYPRWPVYLIAMIAVISIYLFFDTLIDKDTANLLQQLKQLGN